MAITELPCPDDTFQNQCSCPRKGIRPRPGLVLAKAFLGVLVRSREQLLLDLSTEIADEHTPDPGPNLSFKHCPGFDSALLAGRRGADRFAANDCGRMPRHECPRLVR